MNLMKIALFLFAIVCSSFGCASTAKRTDNHIFLTHYTTMTENYNYKMWPGAEYHERVQDQLVKIGNPGCFLTKSEGDSIIISVTEITESETWFMNLYTNASFMVYSISDTGERVFTPYRDSSEFRERLEAGNMFPMSRKKTCAEVINMFPELKAKALLDGMEK